MNGQYDAIKESGFELLAISVDTPEESAKFRDEENLQFELLADIDRKTIREWNVLNKKERGGIAFPNVYVIEQDGSIVFHSGDRTVSRADPDVMLEFLAKYNEDPTYRVTNQKRKYAAPKLKDMILGFPKKLGWIK